MSTLAGADSGLRSSALHSAICYRQCCSLFEVEIMLLAKHAEICARMGI